MRTTIGTFLVGLASVFPMSNLRGDEPPADQPPKVGDQAPDFELVGSDGKKYKLTDFRKKKQPVVVAWYPKAFTGG